MSKISILLTHDDFYLIEKPPGANFHSETEMGFFASFEAQQGEKLYPVHRLDKVTSGILIVARNGDAAAHFSQLFADKTNQMAKFYLAISDRKPNKKQGWIKGDMDKSRRGSYKLLKSRNNPAITRFYSNATIPGKRTFLLKAVTGKTHQLRVAMKSISAPILGDSLYSGTTADRVYLHAYAVKFDWYGEVIELVCTPSIGVEYQQLSETQLPENWQLPWLLEW